MAFYRDDSSLRLKNHITIAIVYHFGMHGLSGIVLFTHSGNRWFEPVGYKPYPAYGHLQTFKFGKSGVLGEQDALVGEKQGYLNPLFSGGIAETDYLVKVPVGGRENSQCLTHTAAPEDCKDGLINVL